MVEKNLKMLLQIFLNILPDALNEIEEYEKSFKTFTHIETNINANS